MKNNLLYLGIGALALIGFYMYKQKQTAPTPELDKSKPEEEPTPSENMGKKFDKNQVKMIKECQRKFTNDADVSACVGEKGLDYDAYLMEIKAIRDSMKKGKKDQSKTHQRPTKIFSLNKNVDNETSNFAFNGY
jgi:hypothetical protein